MGLKNKNGREDRIRTCDPYVPSVVLYQTELLLDKKAFRLLINILWWLQRELNQ